MLILLLMLLLCSPNVKAQWEEMIVQTNYADLYGITMTNPQTGIGCGKGGIVAMLSDSGKTVEWRRLKPAVSYRAAGSFSASRLIIAGDGGTILASDNAGATWSIAQTSTTDDLFAIATDKQTGAAIVTGANGKLLLSANYGAAWNAITINTQRNLYAAAHTGSIWIAVGDAGVVVRSTDNGVTWLTNELGGMALRWVRAAENNGKRTFFAMRDTLELLRSDDDGANWTSTVIAPGIKIQYPRTELTAFAMDSTGTYGAALFMNRYNSFPFNACWITTDGGATWLEQGDGGIFGPGLPIEYANVVAFTGKQHGVAVGMKGRVYAFSIGSGKMFSNTESKLTSNYLKVAAADNKNIVVGSDRSGLEIYLSTDGGDSWKTVLERIYGFKLTGLVFSSPSVITAIADSQWTEQQGNTLYFRSAGYAFRSVDGGVTWRHAILPSSVPTVTTGMSMLPNGTGIISKYGKSIYATDNTGQTWREIPLPDTTLIPSIGVVCLTSSTWLIQTHRFGTNPKEYYMLRTTDAGQSWETPIAVASPLTLMQFLNPLDGYAVTTTGTNSSDFRNVIVRTHDGGKSWEEAYSALAGSSPYGTNYITDLSLADSVTIMAVMVGQTYLQSADGGKTWEQKTFPADEYFSLRSVTFSSPDMGIAVGNNSIAYRWRRMPTTGVNEPAAKPDCAILYQNYPNPCGSDTRFTFSIASPQFVTLTITDIFGKKVAVLVAETLSAGVYEIPWNTAGLESGMYVYRLQAGAVSSMRTLTVLH